MSIVGYEFSVDGRRVRGVIREKEQARDMYDDAIASGYRASAVETGVNALESSGSLTLKES